MDRQKELKFEKLTAVPRNAIHRRHLVGQVKGFDVGGPWNEENEKQTSISKAMRSVKRYVSSAKTAELRGILLTEKSVINVRILLH